MDDMTVKEYAESRNISEESVRIKLRTNLLDGKIKKDVDENSNRKATFLTPEAIALLDCMFYRTIKRNKEKKIIEESKTEMEKTKEELDLFKKKVLVLEELTNLQKKYIEELENEETVKTMLIEDIEDELKTMVKSEQNIEDIKDKARLIIERINAKRKKIGYYPYSELARANEPRGLQDYREGKE